jgi:hypothetical protein
MAADRWFSGEICGARTRAGSPCQRPAGEGTSHGPNGTGPGVGRCAVHGGATPTHEKNAAGKQAQLAAQVMGAPLDIGPHEAIAWCVRITAGEVVYCSDRIRELQPGDVVVADTMERSHQELDRFGEIHDLVETRDSSQARLHIWIEARAEAMKRLAHFSKLAVDAGVAERQVALVEQWAEGLAAYTRTLVGALGLDLHDAHVRTAVEQTLKAHETSDSRADVTLTAGPWT